MRPAGCKLSLHVSALPLAERAQLCQVLGGPRLQRVSRTVQSMHMHVYAAPLHLEEHARPAAFRFEPRTMSCVVFMFCLSKDDNEVFGGIPELRTFPKVTPRAPQKSLVPVPHFAARVRSGRQAARLVRLRSTASREARHGSIPTGLRPYRDTLWMLRGRVWGV